VNVELWPRVRSIFHQCAELGPKTRIALLDRWCRDEPEVRAEVESLLLAAQQPASILDGPAVLAAWAPPEPDEPASWTGRRVGAYELVARIARGGMGEVYRAVRVDQQYEQQVAIKIIRPGLDSEPLLARFRVERQILARLEHPNITRLLDGGMTAEGVPFLVMELVEGQPLDVYCQRREASIAERLSLVRTVCDAVQYAHQHLVVHRDLKPSNILVTSEGVVKLLDFGIAKVLDPPQTPTGAATAHATMAVMTPEYSSPEQVRGEPVTTASDVFSLGVVLFRLLTGRSPYSDTTSDPYSLARAVCEAEPQRPSSAVGGRFGTDLDCIVLKALRKEPRERYVSVEQLAEEIRRYLVGLPVSARQGNWTYYTQKFVRRHKLPVGAVAGVVLAVSSALVLAAHEAQVAREERLIAMDQAARAQQRFEDVRRLANTLIFDVDDAIARLQGATKARELLVTRALKYLDSLAAEAHEDLSLRKELAAAYLKVGDVQGGFRMANLGDSRGALASYRKALAILQGLPATGQDAAAWNQLLTSEAKVANLLLQTGDSVGAIHMDEEVVAHASILSARYPDDFGYRSSLARGLLDLGTAQAHTQQQWREGLANCDKAVAVLESLVARHPQDRALQRVLALAYGRAAEVLDRYSHDPQRSLALHGKALGRVRYLQEGDPNNADLRNIIAWELYGSGLACRGLGQGSAAITKLQAAVAQLQVLFDADPADLNNAVGFAHMMNVTAQTWVSLNRPAEALGILEHAGAILQGLHVGDADRAEVDSALSFNALLRGRAEIVVASGADRSPRAAAPSAVFRSEHWRRAKVNFERALALANQPGGSLHSPERPEEEDVRREIARCEAELARLQQPAA
jgi:tetratricopeptide (TPR) repeat protein